MLQEAISGQQVDALLEQLVSKSEKDRIKAAEELAHAYPQIDDPDRRIAVGTAMLKTLGDKSWPVRQAAIRILPHIQEAWAAEPLVNAVVNFQYPALANPQSCFDSIGEALVRVGEPALKPMLELCVTQEGLFKRHGADYWDPYPVAVIHKYLESVGEAAAKILVSRISTEPGNHAAYHLLVNCGKAAEEPLLDLIRKEEIPFPDFFIYASGEREFEVSRGLGSAALLGNKRDEPYRTDLQARIDYAQGHLGVPTPSVIDDYKALFLAADAPSPAVLTLVALQMEDFHHWREPLIGLLKQLGPSAVERIAHRLTNDLLPGAAHLLGLIGDPAAVEPLAAVLANPKCSQSTRLNVVKALSWIGGVPNCFMDSEWIKRLSTTQPPSKTRNLTVTSVLLPCLKDADRDIRYVTAEVLGNLEDPDATEALLAALNDQNWEVRIEVTKALGKIGDPRAVHGLAEHLTDKGGKVLGMGRGVGGYAAEALKLIGTPEALNAIKERKK